MRRRRQGGERFIGCKIVTVFPDNAKAGAAVGLWAISLAVRQERRAAGDDRRARAHRLAHGLRFCPRGALSGARGCVSSGDGRSRRAGAASRPRACERAADQARHDLEPDQGQAPLRSASGSPMAGLTVDVADRLEEAVRKADIVCCATLAGEPLIKGAG